MSRSLAGRVAIVTGAGGGLGRAHALEMARHGARVVVNDLAGSEAEGGGTALRAVAEAIRAAGGEALALPGDVTDAPGMQAMVRQVADAWGRVDIVVSNAGILRDRTFAKMSLDDFRQVLEVHLMGAVHLCKAVWPLMQAQQHGRIVLTTSSSGLYGNFGQSNYGAAKMALVGLMQTLALEGEKHGVRVNCLAPSAATAMTAGLLPPDALARLTPERVSPGLLALVGDDAPTRLILLAGAGSFEAAHVTMTRGVFVGHDDGAAERLCGRLDAVRDRSGEVVPAMGWEQYRHELDNAAAAGDAMAAPR